MANAKTFSQKPADVSRQWFLVDASDAPLGRIATIIADKLIGKNKPTYTPHVDGGDYVVVINAAHTVVTGDKETQKKYYRHSGFPGGIKDATLAELREKYPEQIIAMAVRGMLPKNKLSADRLSRLKIFAEDEHQHTAQQPKKVEVK